MDTAYNPEHAWRIQKAKLLLTFSHLRESDFHYDYGMKDVMMANLGRQAWYVKR
jgi:hypothetical protein